MIYRETLLKQRDEGAPLWNVPLDDERNLSIAQFCTAEDLSAEQFEYLQETDCGPRLLDWVGGLGPRITPKARREWHKRMANWPSSKEE